MSKTNVNGNYENLPSPHDFLCQIPIYKSFAVNLINVNQIKKIIDYPGPIDLYCKECKQNSVFINEKPTKRIVGAGLKPSKSGILSSDPSSFVPPNYFYIEFFCSRNTKHKYFFCFHYKNDRIQKIGQYPSYADLVQEKLKKYENILGDKYSELTNAMRLVSHGIGIGSFVYLRRIFESLIEEAHLVAKDDEKWDDELYNSSRMEDKVKLLKKHLPEFLSSNYSIYSILSKGIHSLTDEECLEYFQPVQLGIELILDEKIETAEKNKKIASAKKSIDDIKSKLNRRI